jgi:SAM-dependent methyltransferase
MPVVAIDDVRIAYRLLLGREPENEAVLMAHVQQSRSLEDLRTSFFRCPEFQNIAAAQPALRPLLRPLDWPPIRVDMAASDPELTRMMRHIESSWQRLGATEPHWSVLSQDAFLSANIANVEDQFYQSGRDTVQTFRQTAERCGISLTGFTRCLELGCGLGRITVWLAGLFEQTLAADISANHLVIARQTLDRFERGNVELLHIDSFKALEAIPDFDVFISLIVLQHNPPPLIAALLRIVLAKLRPGGIAYFQVPTYRLNYHFEIDQYLRTAPSVGGMEMHLIPQSILFDILRQSGCRMLECLEDNWTGDPTAISNTVFAIKEGDNRR